MVPTGPNYLASTRMYLYVIENTIHILHSGANIYQPDKSDNKAIPTMPAVSNTDSLLTLSYGRARSLSGLTTHTAQSGSPLLGPPHSSVTPSRLASSAFGEEERHDALEPDPGSERDFTVQDNKFAFSPGQLNKLLNPKSLAAYSALGGIADIKHGLRTNVDCGLSVDESNLDGSVSFEEAATYRQKPGRDAKPGYAASPPPNEPT
jgi:Ca2+-transporting ATPase